VVHPEARALAAALAGRLNDPRVVILAGAHKALRARFATPAGARWLA